MHFGTRCVCRNFFFLRCGFTTQRCGGERIWDGRNDQTILNRSRLPSRYSALKNDDSCSTGNYGKRKQTRTVKTDRARKGYMARVSQVKLVPLLFCVAKCGYTQHPLASGFCIDSLSVPVNL